MHFNIEADKGDLIQGWLVPDNPKAIPRVIVVAPGVPEIVVEATIVRPDIVQLGIHATGKCGFRVNADNVPDLAKLKDLRLLEGESGLPIHGRFDPERHLTKKMFLFDCSLAPQRRMIERVKSRFALSYANIEQLGLETTLSVIANHFSKSLFIAGRPLFLRYDHLLKDRGYIRTALLREPYEELAERLIFLRFLAKEEVLPSLMTYTTGVESLIEFARDLPLNDHRAMARAFRGATEKQRFELSSPMTRIFGCDIDEFPRRSHVARALENLASLQVVGTRAHFRGFKDLVAGKVGEDVFGSGAPASFQGVEALAATLARIGPVTDLLADDLALYEFVEQAIAEGIENANAGVEN